MRYDYMVGSPLLDQQFEQYQWLKSQIARFSYKPGAYVEAIPGPPLAVWCRLQVTDSRKPVREIPASLQYGKYEFTDLWDPSRTRQVEVELPQHVGTTIQIGSQHPVPEHILYGRDVQGLAGFIRSIWHETELHESDEWFKLDGQLFDDPHTRDSR